MSNQTFAGVLLCLAITSAAPAAEEPRNRESTVSPAGQPARYAIEPQFRLLRFGEVMPTGWIRAQMIRDLEGGFAGHLPEIAPKTCGSQIFGKGRNNPDRPQDAGGLSGGGAAGMWWNGETEGNWRSGNTMMCLLTGRPEDRAQADARVAEALKTQDADGYLGIYAAKLRWPDGRKEHGELWCQTCLLRGLIAYYEATGNEEVFKAVERAVRLTMRHYGDGIKEPFGIGTIGVGPGTMGHNLMFVDVVERLYDLTGNPAYRDFGVFLYRDFARHVKAAVSIDCLLDATRAHVEHGATLCEWFRVPVWTAYASGDPLVAAAWEQGYQKMWRHISPTGGPVADEEVRGRDTRPDICYECCTQKEWMTSLLSAAQKTGRAPFADGAETTFYNSVPASRLSDGKGLAYCTKDNVYSLNRQLEGRLKHSPCHEDVADCCAPNFTQIGPLFVRNMWMRAADGLAAVLYGPCRVRTAVRGVGVEIAEETSYPFSEAISLRVSPDRPVAFTLHLRVPGWTTGVSPACADAEIHRAGQWLVVTKTWKAGDTLSLALAAEVQPVPANNKELYLRRGPLFYALPIPAELKPIKDYPLPGFHDYVASPATGAHWNYALVRFYDKPGPLPFTSVDNSKAAPRYPWDEPPIRLKGTLVNSDKAVTEAVELVPMGCREALLRRATFPVAP